MQQTFSVTVSRAMQCLIDECRAAVSAEAAPEVVAASVAATLGRYLALPDLLLSPQTEPDPLRYRQHLIHVEPRGLFSIVSLVWCPGQATPIHDHVSWCVVGVYQGGEHEVRYRLGNGIAAGHLVRTGEEVNRRGTVVALTPPGDIHQVRNAGRGVAISIHVYGANIAELGSSIHRRYDLPVRS